MVAVEVKSESQFSSARAQLLTYLAIMHQLRKQNKKPNAVAQGFYSDGWLYGFMAIDTNGVVLASDILNCRSTSGYDVFIYLLINHYSYSDYLAYDERPQWLRLDLLLDRGTPI